jgi:membrane protein DedA with SNARE-associated domain
MIRKISSFFSPGFFPFSICLLLGLFVVVYRLFNLPSPSELTQLIVSWYQSYGLLIVFISAIAESLFMLSIYLPGSLAIVLAVYSLGHSVEYLFLIGLYVSIGFTISNVMNYYLGKYGYYKLLLFFNQNKVIDNMHKQLDKNGLVTIFTSAIHPNFLAVTMVCLGISGINFRKSIFLSILAVMFWVSIWTCVASIVVKEINFQDSNQFLYLVAVFLVWGLFLVLKNQIRIYRSNKSK